MDGIYQAHREYGYAQACASKDAEANARCDKEILKMHRMGIPLNSIADIKDMTISVVKERLRAQGVEDLPE